MNARVLLQMSASEILLHLPNRNQRKAFKDIVESITGLAGGKQYVYFSKRSGGRKERGKRTMKVIWQIVFTPCAITSSKETRHPPQSTTSTTVVSQISGTSIERFGSSSFW